MKIVDASNRMHYIPYASISEVLEDNYWIITLCSGQIIVADKGLGNSKEIDKWIKSELSH